MIHSQHGEQADIDELLSEWGRAARAESPVVAAPADLVITSNRKLRPAVVLQAGAGLLVAALVLLTVVGLPRHLDRSRSDRIPAIGGATSTATPQPGQRVVTFHGLSVTVPASWAVLVGFPCAVTTNSVILPGASPGCGQADTPTLTVIEFLEGSQALPLTSVTATTSTTISGVSATRTDGLLGARAAFGFAVPALRASILIHPAAHQSGEQLTNTLQVNAVDTSGCRAAVSDVASLKQVPKSSRAGSSDQLVPGQPTTLRICRYQAGRLEQGTTRTGTGATALMTLLNGLPEGLSRAPAGTFSNSICKSTGGLGGVDGDDASDSEAYRVEADYASGPAVVVVVRLGFCSDLGATNGNRSGQRTDALSVALTAAIGNGQGYPSEVVPAG